MGIRIIVVLHPLRVSYIAAITSGYNTRCGLTTLSDFDSPVCKLPGLLFVCRLMRTLLALGSAAGDLYFISGYYAPKKRVYPWQ